MTDTPRKPTFVIPKTPRQGASATEVVKAQLAAQAREKASAKASTPARPSLPKHVSVETGIRQRIICAGNSSAPWPTAFYSASSDRPATTAAIITSTVGLDSIADQETTLSPSPPRFRFSVPLAVRNVADEADGLPDSSPEALADQHKVFAKALSSLGQSDNTNNIVDDDIYDELHDYALSQSTLLNNNDESMEEECIDPSSLPPLRPQSPVVLPELPVEDCMDDTVQRLKFTLPQATQFVLPNAQRTSAFVNPTELGSTRVHGSSTTASFHAVHRSPHADRLMSLVRQKQAEGRLSRHVRSEQSVFKLTVLRYIHLHSVCLNTVLLSDNIYSMLNSLHPPLLTYQQRTSDSHREPTFPLLLLCRVIEHHPILGNSSSSRLKPQRFPIGSLVLLMGSSWELVTVELPQLPTWMPLQFLQELRSVTNSFHEQSYQQENLLQVNEKGDFQSQWTVSVEESIAEVPLTTPISNASIVIIATRLRFAS